MFSTTDVASIITLVFKAHYVPYVCLNTLALEVMLELACGNKIDAIKALNTATPAGNLRGCMYAVKAVYAYMGKVW